MISDITPLMRLWPEYYGQEAVVKARQWLVGKRVGQRKRPCAAEELDAFLAGDPQSVLSKTRRLELFRAFMGRLGRIRALSLHYHRRKMRKASDEAEAIYYWTNRGHPDGIYRYLIRRR